MPSQDESPLRGLATSWPALLTLALGVGLVAARHGLESPRPTNVTPSPQRKLYGAVPSRLWQDPLANVMQAGMDDSKADDTDLFTVDMPKIGPQDKVLVLLAWLEANQTPEFAEMRRRERYATLSALNTAGYVPVKTDSLSFVDIPYWILAPSTTFASRDALSKAPVASQTQKWNPSLTNCRVPFEWTRRLRKSETIPGSEDDTAPSYKGVCVVWVYDDLNPKNSVLSFGILKEAVQEFLANANVTCDFCDFAITGRITSDRLLDLHRHDEELPENYYGCLKNTTLYVTYSTAQHIRALKPLANSGLNLEYVIGSDEQLMRALVKELKNRNVTSHDGRIAIISEWDTLYGRVMHSEFHKAASRQDGDQSRVRYYSYLRGIDGKLPVKAESVSAEDKDAGKADKPAEPAEGKKMAANDAEGDAQLDYLRRLVERMKADGETFEAIGILGSDPYDKLLLLQALRPHFPSARFFTTDLDARLLQAQESAFTRNLIVASHFGLTLEDALQAKIPPFRSSYDTASYLACLRASQFGLLNQRVASETRGHVKGMVLVPKYERNNGEHPLPVHLYEVGRNGAFELTNYTDHEDTVGAPNHQRRVWIIQRERLLGVALCVLLFGALVFPVSRTWQGLLKETLSACRRKETPTTRVVLLWSAVAATLLLAGLIFWAHGHGEQEPFSILEGISVWPTIILRLFASLLCVFYIVKGLRDLAKRNRDIREEFLFSENVADEGATSSVGYRRFWDVCFAAWHWAPADDTVAWAWQRFEEHGRTAHRLCRCLVMVAVNLLLVYLAWHLLDHSMDKGRGWLAYALTWFTLALSSVLLFALLFFVIDATMLCYRFVTYLLRHPGGWSNEVVDKFAKACGMSLSKERSLDDPVRQALEPLLMIRLIAAATDVVARLIYYPFIVLLVVIVAQSPIFHTGAWNAPLLLIVLLSAGAAVACAILFNFSAQNARHKALDALDKITRAETGDAEYRAKVKQIRDEIDDMASGVFASFWQNPIVHAVLLPLTGGGFAVLQAFLP